MQNVRQEKSGALHVQVSFKPNPVPACNFAQKPILYVQSAWNQETGAAWQQIFPSIIKKDNIKQSSGNKIESRSLNTCRYYPCIFST